MESSCFTASGTRLIGTRVAMNRSHPHKQISRYLVFHIIKRIIAAHRGDGAWRTKGLKTIVAAAGFSLVSKVVGM